MNLLHVVPSYLPATRYGGPVVSVHGLARALVNRGHRVDVYTTNADGPDRLDVPLGVPVDLDGVRVWYFDITWMAVCWVRGMAAAFRNWPGSFDLVHAHSMFLWPGVAAGNAARAHGVPFVLSPRGMLVPELIAGKSAIAKRLWIALLERRNLRGTDLLHLTSAAEERDVRRCGLAAQRHVVVPNGVDAPDRIDRRPEPETVLYLGRLSWKKNLGALVEAVARLPNCQLTLAGPDDEGIWPGLLARAEALGCAARLNWVGAVDDTGKTALFSRHACLALCSINENFGNVVIEAMAHGCPVLVTPGVGCVDEVLRCHGGVVAAGHDAESVADGLRQLLGNPATAEAQGREGRQHVLEHLSWPAVGAAMEAAYAQVVEEGTRARGHEGT